VKNEMPYRRHCGPDDAPRREPLMPCGVKDFIRTRRVKEMDKSRSIDQLDR